GDFISRDKHVHGDEIHGDKIIYQGPAFSPLNYCGDIADIISFYTDKFVGREQEWARIAQVAGQETPGYLLVEAPAGYGKTALIAHLIQRHETDRWAYGPKPNLLYFFIRQEGQRHTPKEFLRALNSQLLNLLNQPDGVPVDLPSLRGQFSELWVQALTQTSPDHPLLLLVDGLDEQAAGELTIAHLLPTNLVNYVHVVVTSRPNPEPLTQTTLEHPFRQAGVLHLHTFGESEIQTLLQEYGAATDTATKLTSRVLSITQGEPLFARFVCREVAEQGETALIKLEQHPPADVEAYFRQQFKQLDKLFEGDLAWEILGLLTVTLGGVSREEIAEILGAGKRRIRKAIEPIQRFLIGQDRFELMHLQLRKVAVEEFSAGERAVYREKLQTWCRSYQERGWRTDTPGYILAYYAQHLVETNQYEVLYDLISATWMRVKFEATGSHRSFILDLDQAITAALTETPSNLVQTVRCCLIYANLVEVSETIPRKILGMLAELGRIEQALNYARLMPEGIYRSDAYLLISDALIEQDRPQEAQATLEQALIGIDSVKYNEDRASVLSQVSFNLALIGENKQALQLIEQVLTMATEGDDVTLPSEIIWTLATLGEFDRASALVNLLRDEVGKIKALVHLARTLNEVGERSKALSLFDLAVSIAETTESSGYVGQIAQILTFEQAVDHALVIVSTIESLRERVYTLTKVATIVAGAGDLTKAMEVFDQAFVEAKYNVFDLCDLARALFKVGDIERAMVVMSRIPDLSEWETTAYQTATRLCQMAETFVEIKRESKAEEILAQVLSIMEKIEEHEDKVYILSQVVQIMTELGLNIQALDIFEQACDIVKEIEAGWEKASALQTLAQVSSGLGNHPLTIEVIKQAFMTISGPTKWEEFDRIMRVLVKIDAFDQALALIRDINKEQYKDSILCQLAWAAARQGTVEQALVAVRTISAQRDRLKALQGIAQIFIDMEKSGQAMEIIDLAVLEAGSFEHESTKLPVLNEMAKTLI
ncbi:MAG TPA: NACHT domain-containing protein, partial [Anaerolineae bacterium]|nr:NACHT domain-containing protein [Anaerolineae bacterium]